MLLSVALCETYTLGAACGCTKAFQSSCGITYRIG